MPTQIPHLVKVNELFQTGIVVRDVEKGIREYGRLFGTAPDEWWVVTIDDSLCRLTYRGRPSSHSFKAAMVMVGDLMIELLQPLEGMGTYREFLEQRGEGVHHLGHVIVPDLEAVMEKMEKEGFPVVETGQPRGPAQGGGHKWAYIDTSAALGYITEYSQGTDPRVSLRMYHEYRKKKAEGKSGR